MRRPEAAWTHEQNLEVSARISDTAKKKFRTEGIAMARYDVIDGDGHVIEPPHLVEYVEERYRSSAPRVVKDENGYERFALDGKLLSLAHRPPSSFGPFLRPANPWSPQARQRPYCRSHP